MSKKKTVKRVKRKKRIPPLKTLKKFELKPRDRPPIVHGIAPMQFPSGILDGASDIFDL